MYIGKKPKRIDNKIIGLWVSNITTTMFYDMVGKTTNSLSLHSSLMLKKKLTIGMSKSPFNWHNV